ncbi:hypothetical protein [Microbacterium sp.]|uniref:hypothetical protein n=1 Tax=Microbacterium sp. TaxID=51671 RepID=UPI0025FFE0FF|nr:hypothetical protein [Microbacterium sp.]
MTGRRRLICSLTWKICDATTTAKVTIISGTMAAAAILLTAFPGSVLARSWVGTAAASGFTIRNTNASMNGRTSMVSTNSGPTITPTLGLVDIPSLVETR